jgi:hypothetical protein
VIKTNKGETEFIISQNMGNSNKIDNTNTNMIMNTNKNSQNNLRSNVNSQMIDDNINLISNSSKQFNKTHLGDVNPLSGENVN